MNLLSTWAWCVVSNCHDSLYLCVAYCYIQQVSSQNGTNHTCVADLWMTEWQISNFKYTFLRTILQVLLMMCVVCVLCLVFVCGKQMASSCMYNGNTFLGLRIRAEAWSVSISYWRIEIHSFLDIMSLLNLESYSLLILVWYLCSLLKLGRRGWG